MVRMAADAVRWAVRCRGHRGDGSPCKRWAIRGGYVCPSHGGRAPQVRRAAERRLFEIAIHRTLATWMRSPAAQEAQERTALASDRAAIEALAGRLGGGPGQQLGALDHGNRLLDVLFPVIATLGKRRGGRGESREHFLLGYRDPHPHREEGEKLFHARPDTIAIVA